MSQRFVLSIDFDADDGDAAHRIREHLRDVCERQVFGALIKARVSLAVPLDDQPVWPVHPRLRQVPPEPETEL